ncbi:hypothetical protein [Streptomyces noursei]|uniref:hypothetical protein n=1 Tax=Streptomyces noursei TaxID=1971 RepID=UPI001966B93D|nr:hypothetical protein [Streptomyces noursei]QRX92123.1 hypothetical protein JNO44_15795 [Streptomyces noursei]
MDDSDWLWEFDHKVDSRFQKGGEYAGFNGPNDSKMRQDVNGNEYIVLTGGGFAMVIGYHDRPYQPSDLLRIVKTGGGPHAVEVLPDWSLVSASPGGDEVRVHRSGQDDWTHRLDDAHGLLWDDTAEILWALGRHGSPRKSGGHGVLRAYRYLGSEAQEPLKQVGEHKVPTYPEQLKELASKYDREEWKQLGAYDGWWESPHDITPIPGSRSFYITTDARVFRFDLDAGGIEDVSPKFEYLPEIKGLSVHPDNGEIAVLKNDVPGGYTSEYIRFFDPRGERKVGAHGDYKVRWADNDPKWTPALKQAPV